MKILFGEWLPDQATLDNPGATVAKNVIPYAQNYGPLRGLSVFSGALTGTCLGSVWGKDSAGLFYNHAGTATTLEELQADSTYSNVSKAGNYTAATNWEWTKIGNRLIAVDILQNPQYFDLGTSSLYADLAGSPPKARHIANIRNFIVLGNVNDGTAYPERLVWSGYNNSELWTASRATQSDVRDLTGRGGDIQRIVPGQYGVIFRQDSIWVMTYSGPPAIFTLSEVEKGRGTPAPNSVAWSGSNIFYLGNDGFYAFNQGSTPIGTEKVDRWFFDNCAASEIDETRGAVDPKNKLVFWAFKSASQATDFDRLIIYNWATQRWSYGEVTTQVISDYAAGGLTLDDLDTVLTSGIDTTSIPVDSDAYLADVVSLVAFNSDNKLCTFQGDPLEACLETLEAGENNRFSAGAVRPLVSGAGSLMIANGTRNHLTENNNYSLAKSTQALGTVNFRTQARYHRFKVTVTGGFKNAIGVDVTPIRGGLR